MKKRIYFGLCKRVTILMSENAYCKFDFFDVEQSETQLAKSLVAEKSPELEQALEDLCAQFFKKFAKIQILARQIIQKLSPECCLQD